MKNIIRDYPIGSIALLLLACVKFEYHSQPLGWSISSPGLVGGVAVLAIIVVVLLFRIFNAAQDACISRGLLRSRIDGKYDMLIPVAIFLVAVQARWFGTPMLLENGKSGYQWELTWSDPNWAVPFIGALVGVVLLTRVLNLFRAIAHESHGKG
jgi:divalent metal cation (Fe/Co/Zn/Cd) transporter